MSKFEVINIEEAVKIITGMRTALPKRMASQAELFFKENFEAQGFQGNTLIPWRPTKSKSNVFGQQSKGILIASGALKRSLRAKSSAWRAEVNADGERVPYAQLHNDGGAVTIKITAKSRKFFWAMYKHTKNEMWKAMAITKKTSITFKMPKRQFIGESKMLNKELEKVVFKSLKQVEEALFKTKIITR